jgi:hypothetical protein
MKPDLVCKPVKRLREFPTFTLWEDVWSFNGDDTTVRAYKNKQGDLIETQYKRGRRPGLIKTIARLQIQPEKISNEYHICSVGKSAVDGKWYGWSHRAIAGFGAGDRLFSEKIRAPLCKACRKGENCAGLPCRSSVPFRLHGTKEIKTDADARAAAVAFARYVS